jgi:hypothetical protein
MDEIKVALTKREKFMGPICPVSSSCNRDFGPVRATPLETAQIMADNLLVNL